MHCYSSAALGAFCLMCTTRPTIYMTINKIVVMACLAVFSLELNESLDHKESRPVLFKSHLAPFFTITTP